MLAHLYMLLLIAVGSGAVAGAIATALSIWLLGRWDVLDLPNRRSSHSKPTVRGGGIGLAIGTLVTFAIVHPNLAGSSAIALVIAGLSFGAIGLADDVTNGLSALMRLCLQLATSVAVIAILWEHDAHSILLVALVGSAATLWMVSFVNAFNFMDGINGISLRRQLLPALHLDCWHDTSANSFSNRVHLLSWQVQSASPPLTSPLRGSF